MNDLLTATPPEENVLLQAFESMVGQPLILDSDVLKQEYKKAMEKGGDEKSKAAAAATAHAAPLATLAALGCDETWSGVYLAVSAFGEA